MILLEAPLRRALFQAQRRALSQPPRLPPHGPLPLRAQQRVLDMLTLEAGDVLLTDTPREAFRMLARQLGSLFDVPVETALRRTRIFTLEAPEALLAARAQPAFTQRDLRELRRMVLSRQSAYLPAARAVYLATHLLNDTAEEAAHFVRHCAVGPALTRPRAGVQRFYARCLEEAVAFFMSRQLNPARPCPDTRDWREAYETRGADALGAAFVLTHRAAERFGAEACLGLLPPQEPELFHAVTHGLGYLLGEALDSAAVRGELTRADAQALLRDPFEDAVERYFFWSSRMGASSLRRPRASAGVAGMRPASRAARAASATSS